MELAITEQVISDYISTLCTALKDKLTAEDLNAISHNFRDNYYIDIPFISQCSLMLCKYYRLLILPVSAETSRLFLKHNPQLYVTTANANEGGERYFSRIYVDTPAQLLDCAKLLELCYDTSKQMQNIKPSKYPQLIFQREFQKLAHMPASPAITPDGMPIYTVFDIETTGLESCDEIIEIAAIRVVDGETEDVFTELVQPENSIPLDISALTGITDDMLTDAPSIIDIMPRFLEFIKGTILIGHNIATFDIPFCNRICHEIGCPPIKNEYIDTLSLARSCLELPKYRLADIAAELQINPSVAHRALGDCETTLECYLQLEKLMKCEISTSLPSLSHNSQSTKKPKISKQEFLKYHNTPKASSIFPTVSLFDPSHPLYGAVCAFSGDLASISRQQAMQQVVNAGGTCSDSVTKHTTMLILGAQVGVSKKSIKHKKAEQYIEQGLSIQILDEKQFLQLLCIQKTEAEHATPQPHLPSKINMVENADTQRIISEFRNALAQPEYQYDLKKLECEYRAPLRSKPYTALLLFGQPCINFKGERLSYMLISPRIEPLFIADNIPLETASSSQWARIETSKFSFVNHEGLAVKIYEFYLSSEGFDCCSHYMECSSARRCIHKDIMFAGQCRYRQKLLSGIIFYGQNRNI